MGRTDWRANKIKRLVITTTIHPDSKAYLVKKSIEKGEPIGRLIDQWVADMKQADSA